MNFIKTGENFYFSTNMFVGYERICEIYIFLCKLNMLYNKF